MQLIKGKQGKNEPRPQPGPLTATITEKDEARFRQVIITDLNKAQERLITNPPQTFPRQQEVLAVHWHPEFVPLELAARRIDRLYPNRCEELIIPTQHNQITCLGDYCGVEVDCYSKGFQLKVQLLLHFAKSRLDKTGVLQGALEHTFQYRSSQLFDFLHTLTRPNEERLERAARKTGADEKIVILVRDQAARLEALLDRHYDTLPRDNIKNKLLRNFLGSLHDQLERDTLARAQAFLQAVKQEVKAEFPLTYFYRTSEIIEEARAIGAGIVIPHPEQFWPILLAEYDVDGYEIWNPQSRAYTEFLLNVIFSKNRDQCRSQRRLLAFMGDDTHLGEKLVAPQAQNGKKAAREMGLQPAWDDLNLRKQLIKADLDRPMVIAEYRARLAG